MNSSLSLAFKAKNRQSKHRKTKQGNLAVIFRVFSVLLSSLLKALYFAFSFTSLINRYNTAQHTTLTEDGKPVSACRNKSAALKAHALKPSLLEN